MKVIVNDSGKPRELTFPRLMINTATKGVWLMISEQSGILLIKNESAFNVGQQHNKLELPFFVDFIGSITISNS